MWDLLEQVALPNRNYLELLLVKAGTLHNMFPCSTEYRNYSKTPIYRASWGKGIRPGKSRSTVYQGTFYTDLHIKLVFGG